MAVIRSMGLRPALAAGEPAMTEQMTAGAFLFSLASIEAAGSNSPTIPSPCSSDILTYTPSPYSNPRGDPLRSTEGDLVRSRIAAGETMAVWTCLSPVCVVVLSS
eukprot:6163419-Pleurochrysis_carterae.AAC.1